MGVSDERNPLNQFLRCFRVNRDTLDKAKPFRVLLKARIISIIEYETIKFLLSGTLTILRSQPNTALSSDITSSYDTSGYLVSLASCISTCLELNIRIKPSHKVQQQTILCS